MRFTRQTLIIILLAVALLCTIRLVGNHSVSAQTGIAAIYFEELIQQSLKEKKGLTFYIKGQTIGGVVTKVSGPGAIEVRNQTYSRIVIRLDEVDAVAMN